MVKFAFISKTQTNKQQQKETGYIYIFLKRIKLSEQRITSKLKSKTQSMKHFKMIIQELALGREQ